MSQAFGTTKTTTFVNFNTARQTCKMSFKLLKQQAIHEAQLGLLRSSQQPWKESKAEWFGGLTALTASKNIQDRRDKLLRSIESANFYRLPVFLY